MSKKKLKRALSLTLVFLLSLTSFNFSLIANAASSAAKIVGFSALQESIAHQTLPVGGSLDDVAFPESLTATVETVTEVTDEKPAEVIQEQSEEPNENPNIEDALPEEAANEEPANEEATPDEADDTDVVLEGTPEEVPAEAETAPVDAVDTPSEDVPEEDESVDTGWIDVLFPAITVHAAGLDETTTPVAGVIDAATPKLIVEEQTVQTEITIENVGWVVSGDKPFDSSTEGSFVFVPVFTTNYDVVAAVPTITVDIVNTESKNVFEKSQVVDGVRILVKADEGVFPEGATLSVTKVSGTEQQAVEAAVEEKRDGDKNAVDAYTFDIKVLDKDGNEVEPDNSKGTVKVSFTLEEVANQNLDTDVYHIKGEVGDLSVDKLDAKEVGNATVEATTDGFSYYTVEFTYNSLQYVMSGDTTIALSEILNTVGLTGSVEAAASSNDELFVAEKQGDAWVVVAKQAFFTEESLTVTIDGVDYVIVVTDSNDIDQISTFEGLQNAIAMGRDVKLVASITMTDAITIPAGKKITIDGGGYSLNNSYHYVESSQVLDAHRAFTNEGILVLKNVTIEDFIYQSGGAIYNTGTLVVDGCTLHNNKTNDSTGGGAIQNSGKLYARGSTFTSNVTNECGGAINNYKGSAYITGCTFNGNKTGASAEYGGAIGINTGVAGSEVRVIACTFNDDNTYTYYDGSSYTYPRNDIGIRGTDNITSYTIASKINVNDTIVVSNGTHVYENGEATLDYSNLDDIKFTYQAWDGDKIAQIGDVIYGPLSAAVAAWHDGETLVLLADATIDSTISVSGNKTLDLNGHGIVKSGTGSVINIASSGTLTIIDSAPTDAHQYRIISPNTTTSYSAGLATVNAIDSNRTFTGGYITGGVLSTSETDAGYGAGICNNGTLYMNGGTIIGNKTTGLGGGLYTVGTAVLDGTNIIGNTAYNGGGVMVAGGSLTIKNHGDVIYNYASENAGGISFVNTAKKLIVENCKIDYNGSHSAGALLASANGGEVALKDVNITGNGGICGVNVSSDVKFNLAGNTQITNNSKNVLLENGAIVRFDYGDLSSTARIGIAMANPKHFTEYVTVKQGLFDSDILNYKVTSDSFGMKLVRDDGYNNLTSVAIVRNGVLIKEEAPMVGDTLTAECNSEVDIDTIAYQWFREDEPIEGATGKNYTVTAEDLGKRLRVEAAQEYYYTDPEPEHETITKSSDYTSPVQTEGNEVTVEVTKEDPTDGRSVIVGIARGDTIIASKNTGWIEGDTLTATFDGLPAGNYNVICMTGDGLFEATKLVTVMDGTNPTVTFNVLRGDIKSLVNIQNGFDIAVGGLDKLFTDGEKAAAADGVIAVSVEFKEKLEDIDSEATEKIKEIMNNNQTLEAILDLSVSKTIVGLDQYGSKNVGSEETVDIGKDNDQVLEIAIPFKLAANKILSMFRFHNDKAERLQGVSSRSTSAKDGKFYYDSKAGYIYLYASGFSTYAIATEDRRDSSDSGSGYYEKRQPVYRLFNPADGYHFYTANKEERDALVAGGWNDEGIAWNAIVGTGAPVYRLFDTNGGGHVFTADKAIRDEYVAKGWNDEGIAWYTPINRGYIVYKITNPNTGKSVLTISAEEKQALEAAGFMCEKAGFSVF